MVGGCSCLSLCSSPVLIKTVLGQASAWNRFWRDFLEVWGGSEANFLEVCFGTIPYGDFHTKATSKKSGPPSGKFRPTSPQTSEKSLQELFQARGWLEDSLTHTKAGAGASTRLVRALEGLAAMATSLLACAFTKQSRDDQTKNKQNPPPQVPARKYEKITEKNAKMGETLPFLYFFGNFFVFSGGRPGVGDFAFFS